MFWCQFRIEGIKSWVSRDSPKDGLTSVCVSVRQDHFITHVPDIKLWVQISNSPKDFERKIGTAILIWQTRKQFQKMSLTLGLWKGWIHTSHSQIHIAEIIHSIFHLAYLRNCCVLGTVLSCLNRKGWTLPHQNVFMVFFRVAIFKVKHRPPSYQFFTLRNLMLWMSIVLYDWPQLLWLQVLRTKTDIHPKSHLLARTIRSNWQHSSRPQACKNTDQAESSKDLEFISQQLARASPEDRPWKSARFEQPK